MTTSDGNGRTVLSLVVLAWNNLELTKRCVESLRQNTSVDHELILVDNGSEDGTAEFARSHADVAVVNESNLGFAAGMNAGLERASGRFVAFINNDTTFPSGWAEPMLETFELYPGAGIVLPAVTAAGNPVTVRAEPGQRQLVLQPFGEFPSGVVYVMRTGLMRHLGGWNEAYRTASAEDLDLAFTVWAHGLDVVLDERVLVEHVSQATVRVLPDRGLLYRENLEQFLDRWASVPLGSTPLVDSVDTETLLANQESAKTAVMWIRRMLEARDEANRLRRELRSRVMPDHRRRRWFRARS
ncbi:MAG: glycosyltransferase family 2 protein [Acidimicrobiia bacterium]